jgi:hypothetical protein
MPLTPDQLQSISKFVEANWLSLLLFVIALIVSIIIYRRQQRSMEPTWDIRNTNLFMEFHSRIPGLAVTYHGNPVESLSISKIVLWNAGSVTIDQQELDTAEPLHLYIHEPYRMLSIETLEVSGKPKIMEMVLEESQDRAKVVFDFLAPGKGAVFQVVHTGYSALCLYFAGELRQGKAIQRKRIPAGSSTFAILIPPSLRSRLSPNARRRLESLFFVLPILIWTVLIIFYRIIPPRPHREPTDLTPVGVVVIVIMTVMVLFMVRARMIGWRGPPQGLESFEQDPFA